MNKPIMCILGLSLTLTGCQVINHTDADDDYDFDHKVQFKQTQIAEGHFSLEVRATRDARFAQLSSFIMRKSLELCQAYDFNLKIQQGIPYIGQRTGRRNYIQDNLVAELECKSVVARQHAIPG